MEEPYLAQFTPTALLLTGTETVASDDLIREHDWRQIGEQQTKVNSLVPHSVASTRQEVPRGFGAKEVNRERVASCLPEGFFPPGGNLDAIIDYGQDL